MLKNLNRKKFLDRHVNLLVYLIKFKPNRCPNNYFFYDLDEKLLYNLALKNKMVGSLFHFLDCHKCSKKLSNDFLNKIVDYKKERLAFGTLFNREKKYIKNLLGKNKINFVFLKDFTHLNSLKNLSNPYLWGSDIDLLINHKEIDRTEKLFVKNGYGVKNRPPHEITLSNKKTKFDIDLHFLPSIPREYFISKKVLERFSNEVLLYSEKLDGGSYPRVEHLLLMLIISFWSNEFLGGLRSLYQIYILSKVYIHKIDWNYFFSFASKLHSKNVFLVIILISYNIFSDANLNSFFKKKLSSRVRLLVYYLSATKITNFFLTEKWWDNFDLKTQSLRNENYFLSLIASEKISVKRLMRPKIIKFLIKIYKPNIAKTVKNTFLFRDNLF